MSFFINFPRLFGQKFSRLGGVFLSDLIMKGIDIIALSDTCRCCLYFRTAHAAACPVSPFQYTLINLHDRLMKHRISLKVQFHGILCFLKYILVNFTIVVFTPPPVLVEHLIVLELLWLQNVQWSHHLDRIDFTMEFGKKYAFMAPGANVLSA